MLHSNCNKYPQRTQKEQAFEMSFRVTLQVDRKERKGKAHQDILRLKIQFHSISHLFHIVTDESLHYFGNHTCIRKNMLFR